MSFEFLSQSRLFNDVVVECQNFTQFFVIDFFSLMSRKTEEEEIRQTSEDNLRSLFVTSTSKESKTTFL